MTPAEFEKEAENLRQHFGEHQFSKPFIKQIWSEVKDLESKWFRRFVYRCIGERHRSKPPLLPDFRIAAHNERQLKLTQVTESAAKKYEKGLDSHLKKLGVSSLMDAVNMERKKA